MISTKIIKDYKNNGVVVLRNVVPKKWITILKRGLKKNFQNPSKYKCVYEINNNKELFYDDYCNWNKINEYKSFIFQSDIGKIAQELMQSNKVNVFHEHVLVKEIGSKKEHHGIKINLIIVLMEKIIVVFGYHLMRLIKVLPLNLLLDQINGINNSFQLSFLDIVTIKKMVSFKTYQI